MDLIGIICTVVGTIISILGGVWFIVQRAFKSGINSQRLDSLEDSHKEVKESISNLPCSEHKNNISKFDLRYKELQQTIVSTNCIVTEINKWIIKLDSGMVDKLVRKASPLKMTGLGEALFIASGADIALKNNLDSLIKEIEEINPKTAYDVENESLNILLRNMGSPMFDPIKKYLYYSPENIKLKDPEDGCMKEISISIHHIAKLMSINLRDAYLKKHNDIL